MLISAKHSTRHTRIYYSERAHYFVRQMVINASVSIICMLPAVLCGQTEYKPAASFDLYDFVASVPMPAFDSITLTDTHVYATCRVGTQLRILQLSRLGTIVSERTVNLPGSLLASTIDKSGEVHLLVSMRDGTTQIHRYAAAGEHQEFPLISPARALATLGDSVVFLGSDGTARMLKANGVIEVLNRVHIVPAYANKYDLVALDAYALAVIDRYANQIRIIDLRTGSETITAVGAPEVDESLKKINSIVAASPQGVRVAAPVLFHAVASDGNGNLYLGVAPGALRRGMQVVQVGRDGKYVRSMRLLPTAIPRLKSDSNKLGLSLQRNLSIAGSTAATVTPDGLISLFTLQ
ncbi:MAG: hypothetical protein ABJF23_06415 [Bryobacteraceae bacterium]